MPTTEFSYRDLSSLLGKKYRPEELRDRISMLGVDIESIDEDKVVMEVFPNRPDMLSVEGVARALKGVLEIESGLEEHPVKDSGIKLYVDPSVKKVRPHISAAVVKNVSIDDERLISLMNIQEKLHITHGRNRKKVAIGVHDLSKVKPPFTYKAAKPEEISFVPLDSSEKMNLSQILTKHPKGKDYAKILDGQTEYPIIVDSRGDVLSFPPIINGELTRVTDSTTEFFIDVTGTDQKAVDQAMNILLSAIIDRGACAYSVELVSK